MKKILFLFACWILCVYFNPAALAAQQFELTTEWLNGTVYIGKDSRIEIKPDQGNCEELTVTADVGELRQESGFRYVFHASREGSVTLTVQRKIKGKLVSLGSRSLAVKYFPPPVASVSGRKSGPFPLAGFKLQTGVMVTQEGIKRPYFEIMSFDIKIYRNKNLIFETSCTSAYFDRECKDFFQSLRPGDTVNIEHIRCTCPDCRIQALGDLTYIMT